MDHKLLQSKGLKGSFNNHEFSFNVQLYSRPNSVFASPTTIPATSQNCIVAPISRPHVGQTTSKSCSAAVCTKTLGFPFALLPVSSMPSMVVLSTSTRTTLPPSVSSSYLRTDSAKTPTFSVGSPIENTGILGGTGCNWTYLPEDFCRR